ncbi:Mur ligase domain-containing protein [Pontiella sp.]|uniref:Mur ligase domain-containing protein n=1 Tax=Pontiella sp. TaxID=2837462 RepID=UPI00356231AE
MPNSNPLPMRRVHFIGIGGVGMNGLAQLASKAGYSVSGSDRAYAPEARLFKCLDRLGIGLFPQDGTGIAEDTDQVVFSTAIESDNPEILKSNELGIPLLHRAEFLKQLVGDGELIAVAGTAGKTTTTGLLAWIFECLGKDPNVYNGAAILNWQTESNLGNIRKGASNLWIIEADESDKSFLNFHPAHAIITNISKDHYELDELHAMFDRFESQTSGTTLRGDGGRHPIPILGKHNEENAACAVRLCEALGMDRERVREAVATFKGIERRLEIAGEAGGVTVIDDYAHNPAKIAAALSAVAARYGTVHAYWRPHGFTPLSQGLDDIAAVFARHGKRHGGSLFILPVYYAGGTVRRTVTSAELVERIESVGVQVGLVQNYEALQAELRRRAAPGDAILGMGARDPELPRFAKRLVTEWSIPR